MVQNSSGNCKLCVFENNEWRDYLWGKKFLVQEFPWGRRLLCSTDEDRIEFFLRLVRRNACPFHVCYVLEQSMPDSLYDAGRYWSGNDLTIEQVAYFLESFSDFIRLDGRHHVMVVCQKTRGNVVYDHHDYFFVYGGIDALQLELSQENFKPSDFILSNHGHPYPGPESELERLMSFWRWGYTDLEATDTDIRQMGIFKRLRTSIRAWWFDRRHRSPH